MFIFVRKTAIYTQAPQRFAVGLASVIGRTFSA
jgi:hypothetical protein